MQSANSTSASAIFVSIPATTLKHRLNEEKCVEIDAVAPVVGFQDRGICETKYRKEAGAGSKVSRQLVGRVI